MSLGWTLYISVLVLGNIGAAWWLIRWTGKPRPGEPAPTQTTGHVWDGDLTEYNKPMPRWWLYLFYGSMLLSLVYPWTWHLPGPAALESGARLFP